MSYWWMKRIRPGDEDETPFSRLRRLLEDEENTRNKSLEWKFVLHLIRLSLFKHAWHRIGPSTGQPYHGIVAKGSHVTQYGETGEGMRPGDRRALRRGTSQVTA